MSNTFTVTVKHEPVTFTSAFDTLAEAWHFLTACVTQKLGTYAAPASTEFATSILTAVRERRASALQIAWCHKLATDARSPAVGTTVNRWVDGLDLSAIVAMFDRAAAAQKRQPQIALRLPEGDGLYLRRNGDRAREPGSIAMTDGGPYGRNTYYGTISRDGSVRRGGQFSRIEQVLRNLAANPELVGGQHGIATGNCCFCARALSTKASRSVGYGPDCAEKWGGWRKEYSIGGG